MSFTESNGPASQYGERPATPAVPAAMIPVTPTPAQPMPAPGWYAEPGTPGVLRYWNGVGWEEWRKPLVEAPSVTQGQKSMAVAYVLAFFLGGIGAHNFYLGRIGPAIGMLALWLIGVVTTGLLIGTVFLAAVVIWLIVDLCLIPSYVRASALRSIARP